MKNFDVDLRPRDGLSLCSGAGGLDMGLQIAEPTFHSRCYVEWEPRAQSVLAAAQKAGYFEPAPIWDDVTTFDGLPWRGRADTILAGYPCQPFSAAGRRRGSEDERHLWPDVARIIKEVGPRWVYLENVAGHISLGLEDVLRDLHEMGFNASCQPFSAEEIGAPHQRLRIFIVGYSKDNCRRLYEGSGGERAGAFDAARAGRSVGPASANLADATKPRFSTGKPNGGREDAAQTGGSVESEPERRSRTELAYADQARPQRGERWQRDAERREKPSGPSGLSGRTWLFPPRPNAADAWASIVSANPDRAPALARRDVKAAIVDFTSVLSPDEAETLELETRGISSLGEFSALAEQAGIMVDKTASIDRLCRLVDGMAGRTWQLKLYGNGVCPLAAANAWRNLARDLGLAPLNLGTEGDDV